MRKAGGTKALCLNHELGNVALDLRCKGFIDGFAGSVEVLPVAANPEEAAKAVGEKLAEDTALDTILALNAALAGEPAIEAAKAAGEGRKVRVGDLRHQSAPSCERSPTAARSFAIDQQPSCRAICRSSTWRCLSAMASCRFQTSAPGRDWSPPMTPSGGLGRAGTAADPAAETQRAGGLRGFADADLTAGLARKTPESPSKSADRPNRVQPHSQNRRRDGRFRAVHRPVAGMSRRLSNRQRGFGWRFASLLPK